MDHNNLLYYYLLCMWRINIFIREANGPPRRAFLAPFEAPFQFVSVGTALEVGALKYFNQKRSGVTFYYTVIAVFDPVKKD